MPKMSILASFWKPEACGQTVLPDRSVLIGQKLVKNAKIQKFKWDILGDFQTMWSGFNLAGFSQLFPGAAGIILISFIWESELLVMTFSHMISLSSCSSFAKHQYYFHKWFFIRKISKNVLQSHEFFLTRRN